MNGDLLQVGAGAMAVRSPPPCLMFVMQIGLVRESVRVDLDGGGELTMDTLKEIACAFVDRKV